jgi:hypothetical protein
MFSPGPRRRRSCDGSLEGEGVWATRRGAWRGAEKDSARGDGVDGTYGTHVTYGTSSLIGHMSPMGRIRSDPSVLSPARLFALSPFRPLTHAKRHTSPLDH